MTSSRSDTRGVPSPLVEAVTRHKGPWEVSDSGSGAGRTSNEVHKMWVPLNDDFCRCGVSHGDSIRSHELLHAKLSPETAEGVSVKMGDKVVKVSATNIEIAEEYRINHSLSQIEGPEKLGELPCSLVTPSTIAAYMDQGKYEDIIRYSLVGGPSALSEDVRKALTGYSTQLKKLRPTAPDVKKQVKERLVVAKALSDAIPAYAMAAARIMAGKEPIVDDDYRDDLEDELEGLCSEGDSCRECKTRRKEINEILSTRPRPTGAVLPAWSQVQELAAFLEVNLHDLKDQIRKLLDGPPAPTPDLDRYLKKVTPPEDLKPKSTVGLVPKKSAIGPSYEAGGGKGVVWGKNFKITTPPMTQALPPWKIQRVNRAVDEGTIPRYMHRWPSDKRVFNRTKRIPGGSILVDDSGSMGLSDANLDRIIETAPVATVAVYAGRDGGNGGEIRIVAKDGKRVAKGGLSTDYSGNGIDGPALEWLGTQPYPRIWISDGGVSSVSHSFGPESQDDARRICVKHKITMVAKASEAVERLKNRRFER